MIIILKDGVPFEGTPTLNVGQIERFVKDGIWTKDDLARHGLEAAEAFKVPAGKQRVGEPTYVKEGGKTVEVYAVEDIPEEVPLTTAEKLASIGITIAELKTALGIK